MKNNNDAHGTFTTPAEVRIVRTLPGPIERIWEYLTSPEKRARWFCGGVTEQKVGGKVEFAMEHQKIAPNETPPPEYAHVQCPGVSFEGRVLRCEPPRLLTYTFGSDESEVTFELTPQGRKVILVLTHRTRGSEQADICNYAGGWHTHLALLIALLEGGPLPPFWATHARLKVDYEKLSRAAQKT